MKDTVRVKIPKDSYYTLFAEGVLQSLESYGIGHIATFDFSYPVVLYYTFHHHRRLYVIMRSSVNEIFHCNDVSRQFSIIAQLRGRSFDRFKRSLRYIVRKSKGFHKFPAEFYFKLSFLCTHQKNDKINLDRLFKKYYEC